LPGAQEIRRRLYGRGHVGCGTGLLGPPPAATAGTAAAPASFVEFDIRVVEFQTPYVEQDGRVIYETTVQLPIVIRARGE
jgi:hypothetical protein